MHTLTRTSAAPPSGHHARGFWAIAYVFAVTMAFAAAPAPLYVLYAREDGFGSFAVTVIFAAYAVGVVLSLYLAGHLSDRFGRRAVIVPAVVLNIVAGLIFLFWHELGALLVARFVSGLGIGLLAATATAHLAELHRAARPDRSSVLAEVVATAANVGGIGVGPLVAGFLAEWVPGPLTTPYIVFGVLMIAGLVAVLVVPETVEPAQRKWRYRPQRIAVPRVARVTFWAASLVAFVSAAMFGLFTSLAPSFLSGTLHYTSHALAGAISFAVFGSAAVAQILSARWPVARLYTAGLAGLIVGLALVVTAILTGTLALLIVGGVIVGAGAGAAFKAAIASVILIAPPAARGETLAGLFLANYTGISLPVVLLGVLDEYVAARPSIIAFGALMLVLLGTSGAMIGMARRRGDI
jgi:MFS family permease